MTKPRLGDFFSNRQEPGRPGLPVMSVTMNDSLVLRDDIERRLESTLRPGQHLFVRKGDIAYNMMRMWQGACGLAEADGMVSPAYVVLAPKPGIDTRFAYQWFKSERIIHLFWAYSHGLTEDRLRLYFDAFAEIPIAPPPLNEQRRIVAVLETWDSAIAETERLIDAKRRYVRGKINEFAASCGAPLKRLDAIARINVLSLNGETSPDFEFEYFDIAAAEDGPDNDLSGRIAFKSAPSRARRQVSGVGIVYSTVRPLLRRLFIAERNAEVVYSTGYSIIEPTPECLVPYLKQIMVSAPVERQIYARLTGSGYPAINENDLSEIKIPIPNLTIQANLSNHLSSIESEISLLTKYVSGLRTQKRGLMQKLLTGVWRLDARFDPENAARFS